MRKFVILLIVGLVLFTLGGIQNTKYEEQSIKVDATITDIKSRTDADGDYRYTYYGDYEVDGELYENKKLKTEYGGLFEPDKTVGETIRITVDPEKPEKKVAEGGFVITVGVVLTVYSIVMLVKTKKAKEQCSC